MRIALSRVHFPVTTLGPGRRVGVTTLSGMAGALNARGVRTARHGRWHVSSVSNLLDRAEALQAPSAS